MSSPINLSHIFVISAPNSQNTWFRTVRALGNGAGGRPARSPGQPPGRPGRPPGRPARPALKISPETATKISSERCVHWEMGGGQPGDGLGAQNQ